MPKRIKGCSLLFLLSLTFVFLASEGWGYYYPPSNIPPGPPPNYTQVDTIFFKGKPVLPLPPPDSGGYYVWRDTITQRWCIAFHIYSAGKSLEQFHGSILARLSQPPTANVNVFPDSLELWSDTTNAECLKQNDRWGWYRWIVGPDTLYEIWWDMTTREFKSGMGDPNDFLCFEIAGCAIDFNFWSSGHGKPFDATQIYLGANMKRLSSVPGFSDFFAGVSDPYQSQAGTNPEGDPNITIFTFKDSTLKSFNKNGLINFTDTYTCNLAVNYGSRYAGSFVYQGNGIQFSTNCILPPNQCPNLNLTAPTSAFVCQGESVCIFLSATDANSGDIITLSKLSGMATYAGKSGNSPLNDTFCFAPPSTGSYTFIFRASDGTCHDDDTVTISVTVNSSPVASCPSGSSIVQSVCDTVKTINHFTLVFDSVRYDLQVGTSQWCYSLTWDGVPPELSHFFIELCANITNANLVSATPSGASIGMDGTTGLYGIKWDNISNFPANSPQTFCFTLNQVLAVDSTQFAPKAGVNTNLATICGASTNCDTLETPPPSTPDTFFFACQTDTICIPGFTCSDPDNNLSHHTVNIGLLKGDTLCFLPASQDSTYTIVFICVDSCGAADTCMTSVTVKLVNNPPVASCHSDTTVFLCQQQSICIKGFSCTDPDNNLASSTVTGGTLSGDTVCFTPVAGKDSTYKITLICTDSCGEADTCMTLVTIKFNDPPVFTTCPPDQNGFVCNPGLDSICFTLSASDADGDTVCIKKLSGAGTFTEVCGVGSVSKVFCFKPATSGVYTFVFEAKEKGPCGKADTCEFTVTVKIDQAPVFVDCPSDTNVLVCEIGDTLHFPISAHDPDGDSLCITKLINGGFPSSACGDSFVTLNFNFIPTASGAYQFKFEAKEKNICGKADTCMFTVNVKVDSFPPLVDAQNGTAKLCQKDSIPIIITVTDGDAGDIVTLKTCSDVILKQGPTPFQDTFKFFADTCGTYRFCFKAIDQCGKDSSDTAVWIVEVDTSAPKVMAEDGNRFFCNPDTLRFKVCATSSDCGDTICLEKISGNGTFPAKCGFPTVCESLKVYISTSDTYQFVFKATDECGKTNIDTATWVVKIDSAPTVMAPDSSKKLCAPGNITFQVCATDSDVGDLILLEKCNGNGTFPPKKGLSPVCQNFTIFADTSGTYRFCFKATDSCGKMNVDTAIWNVSINNPPMITGPDSVGKEICFLGDKICFNVLATGGDGDSVCLEKIAGPGSFSFVCGKPQAIGQFCWTPTSVPTSPVCSLVVFKATDYPCGTATLETVKVCILPPGPSCEACISASVGEVIASPGAKVKVPITIASNTVEIGGFSLCLEYDPALLTFVSLERGEFFDHPHSSVAGAYKWNYLVWRNNPSTVIHKFKLCIIGIGKMYYYGGICMPPGSQGVLYAEFRLSNNELYRCLRTPVIWERLDPQCIVNAFSDCSGNKVFVFNDTLFYNPRLCPGQFPKDSVSTCAGCVDGGVVFKCDVDPIVMGDVNANGFAYEIGDAVLFASYFIAGPSVFSSDPEIRERQIASSDVNRDGLTLSVADLVFLLRVLSGDTQPLGGSKLSPLAHAVSLVVNGQLIESHSPVDLGAILMTFKGEASKVEPMITGLQVKWGISERETKVLVYGMKKDEKISAGISKLIKIYGDVDLVKVEAAEYYGIPVDANIVISSGKPESYLLSQNYPNPFNATTTIRFATPIDGKVSLKIYNVAGQLVGEFSEFKNAGYHSITWDGNNSHGQKVSSGVYLYKLQVGKFTEIRKMTLLK